MEHPLIGTLDDLTVDQLGEKVSELNKKLTIAMRSGNGHLCSQLRMAIESYQNKYQEKLRESYSSNQNFADKINIQ
jgi:hypothetical protein